ncbi:MAG: glycosyltransferase family 4 protein [Anaerolineales bacterium]|nr:glycosyltransferase family 4 protein [Anaerolineales bacterium]
MTVTLFANVQPQFNPYIALFQKAVQSGWAEPVTIQPRFTLGWVLSQRRAGQVAHLHWLENQISPPKWFGPEATGWRKLIYHLGNNRLVRPIRAVWAVMLFGLALWLSRPLGIRVVYTVHNLIAHRQLNGFYARLEAHALGWLFQRAEAIHVHSQETARTVYSLFGRTHNVYVVPHGNYIGWYPNTLSRAAARQQLGLPEEAFVFLFFGQIAPYKGLEDLLAAFAKLNDDAAWLVIAGKVVQADYGAKIAALAQHPRVVYRPGFVPDTAVQTYFNAADVEVLPYQQITTSGSILLAYSFGCPVVAPARGALSELVTPVTGILYSPGRPNALLNALKQAHQREWSAAMLDAHVRQYDWARLAPALHQLYQSVAATNAPLTSVETPS